MNTDVQVKLKTERQYRGDELNKVLKDFYLKSIQSENLHFG